MSSQYPIYEALCRLRAELDAAGLPVPSGVVVAPELWVAIRQEVGPEWDRFSCEITKDGEEVTYAGFKIVVE